jgi:hypothetical protein
MLGVPLEHVWVDYVGLGGALSIVALEDFVSGSSVLTDSDYDRLAQAINELFMDRQQDHPCPYAEDIDPAENR